MQIREKIREEIIKSEKNKEITEDDRFQAQNDLDEMVKDYIEQIKVLGDRKEEEITTI